MIDKTINIIFGIFMMLAGISLFYSYDLAILNFMLALVCHPEGLIIEVFGEKK